MRAWLQTSDRLETSANHQNVVMLNSLCLLQLSGRGISLQGGATEKDLLTSIHIRSADLSYTFLVGSLHRTELSLRYCFQHLIRGGVVPFPCDLIRADE